MVVGLIVLAVGDSFGSFPGDVGIVAVPEEVFVGRLGAFIVPVDAAPDLGVDIRVEEFEHTFLELEDSLPLFDPFTSLAATGLLKAEHFKSSSGKVTLKPFNGSPPTGIMTLLSILSILVCILVPISLISCFMNITK